MKKNLKRRTAALGLSMVWLLLAGVCLAADPVTPLGKGAKTAPPAAETVVPAFELTIPASKSERDYLGLSGTGTFNIGQIKAEVLLIEVYSLYCPLCQMAAAHVNELYELIQKDPRWKDRIKLIGIAVTNSDYEIGVYRDRYKVPFPLFPDQNVEISQRLTVRGTPTFLGVKLNDGGKHKRFLFSEGGFADPQQFLNQIIRLTGLK